MTPIGFSRSDQDPMNKAMGPIKRILPTAFLAGAILAAPLTAHAADDEWIFEGGGWGHGVGLSQYGALGQAQEGRNAEQILKFYYQGTSLDKMLNDHWTRQPDGLWVGLVSNTKSVDLRAVGGPITVCLPAGECDPETEQVINPGEHWRFETKADDSSQCRLNWVAHPPSTPWSTCSASISDHSPTNRVRVNTTEYARGTVRFDQSSGGFHAVVTLDLETYLYGLAEVPSSWPAEALKAQAIIGRSFALATAVARGGSNGTFKWSACGCHLRSTAADQVYAGWIKEGTAWNGAVNNTNRQIVTHPNSTSAFNVATTYYSSSNGGWSENVEDVFGGISQAWLKAVEDKWSSNPQINPLATWSVRISGQALASSFGWDRVATGQIIQGPPGVLIRFTGQKASSNVERVMTGWEVRRDILNPLGFGYHAPGSPNSDPNVPRVSPYIKSVAYLGFFIDTSGHTFFNDINWLAEQDITRGCNPPDNDRFCPDDHVTRGQMAAFLNRFLDLPPATQSHFNDISGNTFENDINRLAEARITRGCNPPANDRFCPNDRVTREQMAAFIVRALELTANTHDGFNDVSSSNTFYADIGRLATAGITKGCNPPQNTNYCPKDFVTRGQMAAFLHRSDAFR
jgi:hypothetical protein